MNPWLTGDDKKNDVTTRSLNLLVAREDGQGQFIARTGRPRPCRGAILNASEENDSD